MSNEIKDLIQSIRKKDLKPLYVIEGEESFYIDQVAEVLENDVLAPAEKGFNLQILYGNEVKPIDIVTRARQYPMFGQKQVIVVKEAQHIKDWDSIATYAEKPLPSTILAFCVKNGKLDKRTRASKIIAKHGVVATTKKLYDNQVPAWIESHIKSLRYRIAPAAVHLLAEFVGNDLSNLHKEIQKLLINLPENGEITPTEIERYIGINREYNQFELCRALAYRDSARAHKIADYLARHEKQYHIVLVLGSLFSYFNKVLQLKQIANRSQAASILNVHHHFIQEYETAARNYPPPFDTGVLQLLNEYDLKSKNILPSTASNGDLLKELVARILHRD